MLLAVPNLNETKESYPENKLEVIIKLEVSECKEEIENITTNVNFHCDDCGKDFMSGNSLIRHQQFVHQLKFSKGVDDNKNLKGYIQQEFQNTKATRNIRNFCCDKCGKSRRSCYVGHKSSISNLCYNFFKSYLFITVYI